MPVGCANCFRPVVPHVAETGGLRRAVDRGLLAGQEVPGVRGAGPLVPPQRQVLLGRSQRRRLPGIETDRDDLEINAGLK